MSTRQVTAPMLAFKHAGRIGASPESDPRESPDVPNPSSSYGRGNDPEEDGMQAQTINRARARAKGPAGTAALWAAVIAATALAACGTPRVAAADPGFIPAPGTNPKVFSQGDELIINDQLTTTHQVNGGYPIVGYDAGVCTLTRIPQKHAEQTLANCVVTAVWKNGSLTVQGALRFRSRQPEPAVFAVTGGTDRFNGASGTVGVSFTKNFRILTIKLK